MYDIIIIGAGPAGLTAAIYAGRARQKTAVVTGMLPGGLLTEAAKVANFPGYHPAISGMELMDKMTNHAEQSGAELIYDQATAISGSQGHFTVRLSMTETPLECKTVIAALGTRHSKAGLPGENLLAGKGVSYCAVCDAAFYHDKTVAVLGSGDKAVEEAMVLTNTAKAVHLLCHCPALALRTNTEERLLSIPNLHIHVNVVPVSFEAGETGKLACIRYRENGMDAELPCDGAFVAIGVEPNTAILGQLPIELDKFGYIKTVTSPYLSMTSIPGIFAAGDCVSGAIHQAVIAAGMGASAALEAMKFIRDL